MSTTTFTPEVRRQHAEEARRRAVQACLKRAQEGEVLEILDRMIDKAPAQAQSMGLFMLELGMLHDKAWRHARKKLEAAVEPIGEQIGGPTTGEPDDLAREWLVIREALWLAQDDSFE